MHGGGLSHDRGRQRADYYEVRSGKKNRAKELIRIQGYTSTAKTISKAKHSVCIITGGIKFTDIRRVRR